MVTDAPIELVDPAAVALSNRLRQGLRDLAKLPEQAIFRHERRTL